MLENILNIIQKEIEFYKDKNNNEWSGEKNEGFKLGIKYCKDIILAIKERSIN